MLHSLIVALARRSRSGLNPWIFRSDRPLDAQHPVLSAMRVGYLYLETSNRHPGVVRIVRSTAAQPPDPLANGRGAEPAIRYIARFPDVDAAQMHAHNALRRRLLDVEARTYRASLVEAIAALAAIELPHRRIYLDSSLDERTQAEIAARIRENHHKHTRTNLVWQIVGGLGIGLLMLLAFVNLRL